MITLEDIKKSEEIKLHLNRADQNFAALGYKEHGERHAQLSADVAKDVMIKLGAPERDAEVASIAAYLHDVGHSISNRNHAQQGAIFTLFLLRKMGMDTEEIFKIVTSIGTHEDKTSDFNSPIAAAVVLGDKMDVHKGRVRKRNISTFDAHDRVNWACQKSILKVDRANKVISIELSIDAKVSSVLEYFQIFLERTRFASQAAKYLGFDFALYINGDKFL